MNGEWVANNFSVNLETYFFSYALECNVLWVARRTSRQTSQLKLVNVQSGTIINTTEEHSCQVMHHLAAKNSILLPQLKQVSKAIVGIEMPPRQAH